MARSKKRDPLKFASDRSLCPSRYLRAYRQTGLGTPSLGCLYTTLSMLGHHLMMGRTRQETSIDTKSFQQVNICMQIFLLQYYLNLINIFYMYKMCEDRILNKQIEIEWLVDREVRCSVGFCSRINTECEKKRIYNKLAYLGNFSFLYYLLFLLLQYFIFFRFYFYFPTHRIPIISPLLLPYRHTLSRACTLSLSFTQYASPLSKTIFPFIFLTQHIILLFNLHLFSPSLSLRFSYPLFFFLLFSSLFTFSIPLLFSSLSFYSLSFLHSNISFSSFRQPPPIP